MWSNVERRLSINKKKLKKRLSRGVAKKMHEKEIRVKTISALLQSAKPFLKICKYANIIKVRLPQVHL